MEVEVEFARAKSCHSVCPLDTGPETERTKARISAQICWNGRADGVVGGLRVMYQSFVIGDDEEADMVS